MRCTAAETVPRRCYSRLGPSDPSSPQKAPIPIRPDLCSRSRAQIPLANQPAGSVIQARGLTPRRRRRECFASCNNSGTSESAGGRAGGRQAERRGCQRGRLAGQARDRLSGREGQVSSPQRSRGPNPSPAPEEGRPSRDCLPRVLTEPRSNEYARVSASPCSRHRIQTGGSSASCDAHGLSPSGLSC